MELNYYGVVIAIVMLVSTGLGHIIVIKSEYHLGVKVWPFFLIIGILFCLLSFLIKDNLLSGSFAIIGVTFLWGIHELFKQRERVEKGWFPKKNKN